jgi:eukaryotic-like serine/threonine-protein kinase
MIMVESTSGSDLLNDRRARRAAPIFERLGDYRILREIGRGGMGIVFEAVQESLGRHVALKVLTQQGRFGSVHLLRFQREARAAALLHHTNIVPVFGVGEHEGVHYYAMQYIEGPSLDTVLRRVIRQRRKSDPTWIVSDDDSDSISGTLHSEQTAERLSALESPGEANGLPQWPLASSGRSLVERSRRTSSDGAPARDGKASTTSLLRSSDARYFRSVARVASQAAEALAYAHLHGVLHRDIKPGNLLLDHQGTVWVTDFGLAKAQGADELTNPGDVVGTLRYVAPERFHGQVDPRSDVYSLGLTLYEMVTLKPAFVGSQRVQLMNAILHAEPVRPRKIDTQIPLDLETIVLKAIAKDPADRFPSAAAMSSELERYLEGRPIRSRRVSLPERIWRWSQRNRAVALLLALAAGLSIALLSGSVLTALTFRKQRDAVQQEQRKTALSLEDTRHAQRQGRIELGRSKLVQARAIRYSGQPQRRFYALETLKDAGQIAHENGAPSDQLADLRDEAIAALALPGDRVLKKWSSLPRPDSYACYSVETDQYVFVRSNGVLTVRRLSDRLLIREMGADRPADRSWPVFVPGGRFVYLWAGPTQIELWDVERAEVPPGWPSDVRCATARADGRQIAALLADGELRIYDLSELTEVARWRVGATSSGRIRYPWMSLSGDGRRIALMIPDEQWAAVYDVKKKEVILELEPPGSRVDAALALSQNGGMLALVHDRAISVFDVADGERLSLLQGHQSEGIVCYFQPGGDLLASHGWDGTTRLWDPIRGRPLLTLTGSFREWMPDGRSLAMFVDSSLVHYEIAAGRERRTIDFRTLGDHAGAALFGPARVAYSPDGQMIAMAGRPEGVRIARAADGVGLAHLPIGDCDEVLYLSDGSLLTFNRRGLCRWPVRRLSDGALQMGPADPLALFDHGSAIVAKGLAASADGRLVGVGSPSQPAAVILDPDQPRRRKWLMRHEATSDLAISPDGRWVATAAWSSNQGGAQVRVWDAQTAKPVAQFPIGNSRMTFSPDGRWLGVATGSQYRFFRTADWTEQAQVDHGAVYALPMAFHPTSRIAAVLTNQSTVRLVDVATGDSIASLEAPEHAMTTFVVFSPDGRYLAAAQSDQRVDIWDLSALRASLLELDLDTGFPDIFGGRALPGDSARIDRIDFKGADPAGLRMLAVGQILRRAWFRLRNMVDSTVTDPEELLLRGMSWERMGHWQLAAADYRATLAMRPDSTYTAYSLVRCLTLLPGRGPASAALPLARAAAEQRPNNANYQNTLGAVLYRIGEFQEAVPLFERNIPRDPSRAGFFWLFLAMARERLGQSSQARTALTEAVRWRATASGLPTAQRDEFQVLLGEAQSVVDGNRRELPANVFAR